MNMDDFLASVGSIDHHEWFSRLVEQISVHEQALIQQTAKAFVSGLSENDVDTLSSLLKESIRH